jgi:peptidoglycan/LPS O-acetylase OafA/YrhL
MRGVAAMLVVLYHLGIKTNHMVPLGYLAVDLFFGLSGFVIAWNYEQSVLSGKMTLRRFVRVRLIRLYPLYLLGLLGGLIREVAKDVSAHVGNTAHAKGWLPLVAFLGIALLPTLSHFEQLFPLNPPSWSLFQELLVNALFATVFVHKSSQVLLLVAGGALIFLVLTVSPPYYLDLGWNIPTFAGGLARTLLSFPLGMVVCRMSRRWKRKTSWLALLPIFCIVLLLCTPQSVPMSSQVELAYIVIGLPSILIAGVVLEPPPELISGFAFLGDLSYPLYILHSSLTFLYFKFSARSSLPQMFLGIAFFSLLIAFAAGAAHYYDRPVRGWLNRRIHERFAAPEQIL